MKTSYEKRVIPSKSCENVSHYEVVEHKGKKFLIYILAENGYPLGFNTHCCLKVMNESGSWDNVVDNKQIGFVHQNDNLYYGRDLLKKNTILTEEVNQFKDYIKSVY